jgi:hypothetical protein
MESKLKPWDFFTLLLALLLGGGIAAYSRRDEMGTSVVSQPDTVSASDRPASFSPSASFHASRQSLEAVACASAWESLKDGRLTRSDRIQIQVKLFDEWSRHDLSAALIAFCSESGLYSLQDADMFYGDLLPVMKANPEQMEELLASGRLGLKTGFLRATWFRNLAEAAPVGVLNRLAELPASQRKETLDCVVANLPSLLEDPATWKAGMDRISAILAGPQGKQDVESITSALAYHHSYEDLNSAYLATEDLRLQELFVQAAGTAFERREPLLGSSGIAAEIQSLPEPLRSAVSAWQKKAPAEEPLPPAE